MKREKVLYRLGSAWILLFFRGRETLIGGGNLNSMINMIIAGILD
jgi:hypothetical protein